MRTKKTKVEAGQLLEMFTDAVVEHYHQDPCRAGLVISHLARGWYVSVCRYKDKFGGGKCVVMQGIGPTLLEAATACARDWEKSVTARKRLEDLCL